jgi:hypothetical protein
MLHRLVVALSLVIASHVILPIAAEAQSLGAFRWQLQPYCNVLTLTVTQSGGAYRLEGTDDQCGSARAGAIGMAFQRLDGTIGLGLTIVGSPDGSPVHIDATISVATLGGTWRDSVGNSGAFVSTPGAGVGGSPRPSSQPGGLNGVSLGFGLSSTTGADNNVSLEVDVEQVKAGLDMRTPNAVNLAIGLDALSTFDTTADSGYNTAFGNRALKSLTDGALNTAVGDGALAFTTRGSANTAVGVQALANNTIGNSNVAIGDASMYLNSSGASNVGIGDFALERIRDGSRNVGIGWGALRGPNGSDNIAIGYEAGQALYSGSTSFNNIFLGSPGFVGDNNTIRIGRPGHVSTFIAGIVSQTSGSGVPVYINAGGKLGTVTSSIRYKTELASVEEDARRLHLLNPQRFFYKPEYDDGSRQVQFGLIAEDVATTFPELVARDEEGRPWTVRYHLLTPLLLSEVQRLERERMALMEALAARDRTQALRVDELTREIAELRKATGNRNK